MNVGNISFDLDGVLRNFTRGFTRIAHKLFGTPVSDPAAQQCWMFEDFPELGLDKAQCDWHSGPIWKNIKASTTFWKDLDPINVSVMQRINRIKNKVFITNTVGTLPLEQSIDFLERWGVKNPNVVVAEDKGPAVLTFNVVAHIDDYLKNLVVMDKAAFESSTFQCRPYYALLDVPYTKTWQGAWKDQGGAVVLSVDHFINECDNRGLTVYSD